MFQEITELRFCVFPERHQAWVRPEMEAPVPGGGWAAGSGS